MKKSFTIAGGGIGGLVTALCLHKNGHEVRVYESVNELKPLGVGINLLPHAVRILDYLGLVPELEKIGIKTSNLVYANRLGQIFLSDPRGTFAGYKWPQFSIHRGLLQQMLYRQCVATLGSDKIILGHHLESFSQTEDAITAVFTQNNDTKKRVLSRGGKSHFLWKHTLQRNLFNASFFKRIYHDHDRIQSTKNGNLSDWITPPYYRASAYKLGSKSKSGGA